MVMRGEVNMVMRLDSAPRPGQRFADARSVYGSYLLVFILLHIKCKIVSIPNIVISDNRGVFSCGRTWVIFTARRYA